jgi:hypothetical protein
MATLMTGSIPWFSHYDEVKVPEGYHLRHYKNTTRGDKPSHRTIIVGCSKTHEKVAEIEEYYDPCAGKARYGAVFRHNNGDVTQRFSDYNLEKLFIVICARHRLGVK